MNSFTIRLWNIKGIKSSRKKKAFCHEVCSEKDVDFWAIQEHHLDAKSPQKQSIGNKLIFYGEGTNSTSEVLSIIDKNLELVLVYNHPSGRVLRVQLKWEDSSLCIVNAYAPNLAKERAKL